MRDIDSLKESDSEPNFFNHNLVERTSLVRSFNKSWRRESISRKSVSSNSTTYTNNLNILNSSNNIKLFGSSNTNRKLKHKDNNYSKTLDIIYQVINDLYEEEIVPSIHEIRRKLNRNQGFSVGGQNLLKICSSDERFKIIRLQTSVPNSKDVQNEWAILVKNRPFNYFNKEVDNELLSLVSDYLVFISSYQYHKLTNDTDNTTIDQNNINDHRDPKGNGKHNNTWEHNNPSCFNSLNNNNGSKLKIFGNQRGVNMIPSEEIFNIGGRYLFAEHLKKNGPSKLRKLPLGTINNLIQKLNEIGLLVYKENCLVPISNSKSAANKYILNLTKSFNKGYLDDVKKKFISLFDSGSKIPLSSLPIVYKRAFGEELNYNDIGYERLSDFIKNEVPSCKITKETNQFIISIPSMSDKSEESISTKENQKQNPSNNQTNFKTSDAKTHYPKTEQNNKPEISNLYNITEIVNSNNLGNNQISQFDLNPWNSTVLYPLKITRF